MARAAVLDRPDETTPAPGVSTARNQRARSRRAMLVAAFIVVTVGTALGLRGHAMWFDELQAWNIARSSHSLRALYAHLRYEGHPIVWYLPLFALTRFTGNPRAMQVLQWAIATTTFAIVLFRSPFSVPMRIMVVGGYFFAFEYGVITRSYGLCALLVVLAAMLLARPRPAWWSAAAVLALLAWTSLPGAVLAIAYAVAVAFTSRARLRWSLTVGIAAVVAALTCVPPTDFSGSFAPGLAGDASTFGTGRAIRAASAIAGTWRGLVPIPASIGEWNSNLLDGRPGAVWIEAALSLLLFVVILRALRPFPFARRLWWIGSLGYVGFFMTVILPEQSRYAGFVFLLFLSCAWLAIAPPGAEAASSAHPGKRRPALGALLVLVLAGQIVATITIYPTATAAAFAREEALAQAVHAARLDDAIVSGQDWDGTAIGGYLDRPVYSVARHQWIRYFTHDEREAKGFHHLTDHDVRCAAETIASARARPVAIVTDHHMRGLRPIGRSENAVVYRVNPSAQAPHCPGPGEAEL
jgi:hypothetical protein